MGILKNIKEMLSSDGKLSSKRVITFSAFLLVATAFLASIFFSVKIEEFLFTSMTQLVFAGLGVTVGEYLLKKRNETVNNQK